MQKALSFDDILVIPKFSEIKSRKDVYPYTIFSTLQLPVISSNMDSVTGSLMSQAMLKNGAMACLHRFCTIDENIKMFQESFVEETDHALRPWVSIGLGDKELERAKALHYEGAQTFVVDVAHGANSQVVKQVEHLREVLDSYVEIIVGNFATKQSILDFQFYLSNKNHVRAFKVGIGGGSACTTRMVTGCGMPTFSSILNCRDDSYDIIADGGIRNSGDVCKAIAAGASAVMIGGMLAGTDEAPGEVVGEPGAIDDLRKFDKSNKLWKHYRGSASQESYVVQNKVEDWRTAEGESFMVRYKGPVKNILKEIEAGLRSSMSYVGARNIKEFQDKAEFIQVTSNGYRESQPHGKV